MECISELCLIFRLCLGLTMTTVRSLFWMQTWLLSDLLPQRVNSAIPRPPNVIINRISLRHFFWSCHHVRYAFLFTFHLALICLTFALGRSWSRTWLIWTACHRSERYRDDRCQGRSWNRNNDAGEVHEAGAQLLKQRLFGRKKRNLCDGYRLSRLLPWRSSHTKPLPRPAKPRYLWATSISVEQHVSRATSTLQKRKCIHETQLAQKGAFCSVLLDIGLWWVECEGFKFSKLEMEVVPDFAKVVSGISNSLRRQQGPSSRGASTTSSRSPFIKSPRLPQQANRVCLGPGEPCLRTCGACGSCVHIAWTGEACSACIAPVSRREQVPKAQKGPTMRHDPANMHVNITESLVDAGTGISADCTDFTLTVLQVLGGSFSLVLPSSPPEKDYCTLLCAQTQQCSCATSSRRRELPNPAWGASWGSKVWNKRLLDQVWGSSLGGAWSSFQGPGTEEMKRKRAVTTSSRIMVILRKASFWTGNGQADHCRRAMEAGEGKGR